MADSGIERTDEQGELYRATGKSLKGHERRGCMARVGKMLGQGGQSQAKDKALFRLRQLDHDQANTLLCSGLFRRITRIALVNKRDLDVVITGGLDLLCQFGDLRPILFIGRCDMQSQPIPQRIDGHMNLASFPAFGAIIAGPLATFRRGLQRPTVKVAALMGVEDADGSSRDALWQTMLRVVCASFAC